MIIRKAWLQTQRWRRRYGSRHIKQMMWTDKWQASTPIQNQRIIHTPQDLWLANYIWFLLFFFFIVNCLMWIQGSFSSPPLFYSLDIPDGENPEFLMVLKTLHIRAEMLDRLQSPSVGIWMVKSNAKEHKEKKWHMRQNLYVRNILNISIFSFWQPCFVSNVFPNQVHRWKPSKRIPAAAHWNGLCKANSIWNFARQWRGLSRSAIPWSWVMKKSNTEENGVFVGLQKFEAPLQDAAKPDPGGHVPRGEIRRQIIAWIITEQRKMCTLMIMFSTMTCRHKPPWRKLFAVLETE